MSLDMMTQVVPKCPQGLSIEREDFLRQDFSIDAFLAKATASYGLERLRDDLGVYLKTLRASMIELINDDYADFVDLSTNLVGLDKTIDKLERPLKIFREAAGRVEEQLAENIQDLETKLKRKETLYRRRVALQNLEHIINTLSKTERLLRLKGHDADADGGALNADLVERVASEVHHLNLCMTRSKFATSFIRETQPRLGLIIERLNSSMESHMLDAIRNCTAGKDDEDGGFRKEVLKRALRIYAAIDRVSEAEFLIRRQIIGPYLEDVMSEKSLSADPQGLKGVWSRVSKIMTTSLAPLLQLTQSDDFKSSSDHFLKDFNVPVRCLWPEVVDKFEDNLAPLFSAGDPVSFHSNYSYTMAFLEEFEQRLLYVEEVQAFRQTEAYVNFVGRWNLAVYFQIRLQEIALPVETSMENVAEGDIVRKKPASFRLPSSNVAFNAIKKAWEPSIFLPSLMSRFWKLTLQILSRFTSGIDHSLKACRPDGKEGERKDIAPLKSLETSQAMLTSRLSSGHPLETSKLGHHSKTIANFAVLQNDNDEEIPEAKVRKLVALHLDLREFVDFLQDKFLVDMVLPVFPHVPPALKNGMEESVKCSCDRLQLKCEEVGVCIVNMVASKSLPHLRHISDIPRLYRRTNRELPNKPCPYLTSLLLPIQAFYNDTITGDGATSLLCPPALLHTWCVDIVTKVAERYLQHVSEVLGAVQKMEESLRRLKRVRDKSRDGDTPGKSEGGQVERISDDDRIRLQLHVDVEHFSEQVEKGLQVRVGEVKPLIELKGVIGEATASCFESYEAEIKKNSERESMVN